MSSISATHADSADGLADRRRFAQQLVPGGKLAALGQLTAGAAHEINNPLFAILGLLEFLIKDAEPGTKTHGRLELIQATALEIKEIIRALLDFAHERSDEIAVLRVEDVIHETVELLAKTTADHDVEIVEELDGGPYLVSGNSSQLKQIFLNLIGNARQAMPSQGGTIRVSVSADADTVTAVVRDDGSGLLPEELRRVFEPFYTTTQTGTGLGLTIGAGIAESHGGSLTATSTPGEGSAFSLRLPRHPA